MPRPREFDDSAVIAAALGAFWQSGYTATSFDALEEATGLGRSSLYNAYGGKLELFCCVLDAYRSGPCLELHAPLHRERGLAGLHGYLDRLAKFIKSDAGHSGCLMVKTSLEPPVDESVDERVASHFKLLRQKLRRAYREAVDDGQVAADLKPTQAANWLLAVVRGVLCGVAAGESGAAMANVLELVKTQLERRRGVEA